MANKFFTKAVGEYKFEREDLRLEKEQLLKEHPEQADEINREYKAAEKALKDYLSRYDTNKFQDKAERSVKTGIEDAVLGNTDKMSDDLLDIVKDRGIKRIKLATLVGFMLSASLLTGAAAHTYNFYTNDNDQDPAKTFNSIKQIDTATKAAGVAILAMYIVMAVLMERAFAKNIKAKEMSDEWDLMGLTPFHKTMFVTFKKIFPMDEENIHNISTFDGDYWYYDEKQFDEIAKMLDVPYKDLEYEKRILAIGYAVVSTMTTEQIREILSLIKNKKNIKKAQTLLAAQLISDSDLMRLADMLINEKQQNTNTDLLFKNLQSKIMRE